MADERLPMRMPREVIGLKLQSGQSVAPSVGGAGCRPAP